MGFVDARGRLQEAIISKVSQLGRKNFPASPLKKTNRLGFHRINLCMEPAWSDHSENVGLTALVTRSLITTSLQAARVCNLMLKIRVPLYVTCGASWRRPGFLAHGGAPHIAVTDSPQPHLGCNRPQRLGGRKCRVAPIARSGIANQCQTMPIGAV